MPIFRFDFLPKVQLPLPQYLVIIFTLCIAPIILVFGLDLISRRTQFSEPRGCRKLGIRIASNLSDEFKKEYAEGKPEKTESKTDDATSVTEYGWRVKSLWVYPVKSCTGIELFRGNVVETGMQYDRQFCFARERALQDAKKGEPKWSFLTQRQLPLMARIKTELWIPDPASSTYHAKASEVQSGGVIIISFPDPNPGLLAHTLSRLGFPEPRLSFKVPFNPTDDQIRRRGYVQESVRIWKDAPTALNLVGAVPSELAAFLGNPEKKLTLFRITPGEEREVFRCAPTKDDIGWQPITAFADAYPLHLINLASVRDVNSKLPPHTIAQLSARRFRPNIIVTGPPAYAEDSWKKIRIRPASAAASASASVLEECEYSVACRTARCRLPNTDPVSGEKHPHEPDRTLKSFRKVDPGAEKDACLGMQLVGRAKGGSVVRVGDVVEVMERGEHFYLHQ